MHSEYATTGPSDRRAVALSLEALALHVTTVSGLPYELRVSIAAALRRWSLQAEGCDSPMRWAELSGACDAAAAWLLPYAPDLAGSARDLGATAYGLALASYTP